MTHTEQIRALIDAMCDIDDFVKDCPSEIERAAIESIPALQDLLTEVERLRDYKDIHELREQAYDSLMKAISENQKQAAAIKVLRSALNELCDDYARFIDEESRDLLTKAQQALKQTEEHDGGVHSQIRRKRKK